MGTRHPCRKGGEFRMLESEYQQHLKRHFLASINEPAFWRAMEAHAREPAISATSASTPPGELLDPIYCPVMRAPHRSPTCVLRPLVLMTLLKVPGITALINKLAPSLFWPSSRASIPRIPPESAPTRTSLSASSMDFTRSPASIG